MITLDTSRDSLVRNSVAVARALPGIRGVSLVHAWHSRGFELAWALGRRFRVPTVGSLHDHPRATSHGPARRFLMRLFAGRLTHLIGVSHAVCRSWADNGMRTPQTVIHNGIMDIEGASVPAAGTVTIGFTGMYADRIKGFPTVKGWIEALPETVATWHLYGTVNPRWKPDVERLQQCRRNVRVLGQRPRKEIYAEIDVLVHPSAEFDPFPTSLLEAACAGLPAVATDAGGSSEIVDQGTTGYLFPTDHPDVGFDRLQELIENADARRDMGRAARRRYEADFQVETMIAGYRSLWSSLCGVPPPASVAHDTIGTQALTPQRGTITRP